MKRDIETCEFVQKTYCLSDEAHKHSHAANHCCRYQPVVRPHASQHNCANIEATQYHNYTDEAEDAINGKDRWGVARIIDWGWIFKVCMVSKLNALQY
jgi:hypothetical protein